MFSVLFSILLNHKLQVMRFLAVLESHRVMLALLTLCIYNNNLFTNNIFTIFLTHYY